MSTATGQGSQTKPIHRERDGPGPVRRYKRSGVEEIVKRMMPKNVDQQTLFNTKIKEKVIFLGPPPQRLSWLEKRKQKHTERARMRNTISSKQRKELNSFDIDLENKTFSDFAFMNDMWKQYAASICFGMKRSGDIFAERVTKMDLSGAFIKVTRSKCPSLVDCSGIVLQETENTFKVIAPDNKVKVLMKKNSVFQITIGGSEVEIFGNQFVCRSADRASKKFKSKPSVDL